MHISVEYGGLVDTPLARLAAHKHGVVATRRLEALGFSESRIRRMCERGWLFRIHWGCTRSAMRYTDEQLVEEPERFIADLRAAMAR
jgi:hypothetical protein